MAHKQLRSHKLDGLILLPPRWKHIILSLLDGKPPKWGVQNRGGVLQATYEIAKEILKALK